jgi:hypothetical protein
MISQAIELGAGLAVLAAQGFALFLMVLGAIDLYGHIKERGGK